MGVFQLAFSIPPMGIESNGDKMISGATGSALATSETQTAGLLAKAVCARANLRRVLARIGVQSRGVLL